MREPSKEFLDVANALDTSDRRSESGVIPEEQVKAMEVSAKLDITWESGYLRIVEALPFLFREQFAKFGVSNSNGLEKSKGQSSSSSTDVGNSTS